MKFLKWAETIKQTVSKEDILNRVEKAEIINLIVTGAYAIGALFGVLLISLAPTDSRGVWIGMALIVVSATGYLESTIKAYLKLERYKAIWDKMDFMQSETRRMQAKDLEAD